MVGGKVDSIHIKDKDDYRLDRVMKQQAPVGTTARPVTTHRFVYHATVQENTHNQRKEILDGYTEVYDAYDHLTKYAYDRDHRLTSIARYRGNSPSSYTRHVKEVFLWGSDGESTGNLLGKICEDGKRNPLKATYFTYDARGNVLSKRFYGRLTGHPSPELNVNSSRAYVENGCEYEEKTYTYSNDGLNLLLMESDSQGKTLSYLYVPETDHVQAKYTYYDYQLQTREFYFYDKDYVLIKKVCDDGKTLDVNDLTGASQRFLTSYTPRQTAPFGLPEKIEEKAWNFSQGREEHLKTKQLTYSPFGQLIQEDVFDANHQFAYTLAWEYDDHGNLIRETNALGQTTIKKYDANDNLIFQQGPSLDVAIHNTYDFANRLIQQEECHTDGSSVVIRHTYDRTGNCIASVDAYGHETRQEFDEFGRIIATYYPPLINEKGDIVSPVTRKIYNPEGYPTHIIDAKGRIIHIQYNCRGQPIHIVHPDGTTEEFRYRLDGKLVKKVGKDGISTEFSLDPVGRITEERVYGPDGQFIKKKMSIYNALHLLQTLDEEGIATSFGYDCAGRLEWTFQDERRQQQIYDALGRVSEVREWTGHESQDYRTTVKEFDLLNRVIEERMQKGDGTVVTLCRNEYDEKGNCTLSQTGEETTLTTYDAHEQPIKIINGLGNVTYTTYDKHFINAFGQRVLQAKTTDPLGYQIVHTYDTANRLVEISRLNPFGVKVSYQLKFYDVCGQHCVTQEAVMEEGEVKKWIKTYYVYSIDDQLEVLIEAADTPEQKVTSYGYNHLRQKILKVKPDGVVLHYAYDLLGRLKALASSDGTIAYVYDYNLKNQITSVLDSLGKRLERTYDRVGQLTQEKLGNELSVEYVYDTIGRIKTVTLPDGSQVEYVHDTVGLKHVHRLKDGVTRYSKTYCEYTQSGKLSKVQLPGENGEVNYQYNGLGYCVGIHAEKLQQTIPPHGIDAAGNILCYDTQEGHYSFDYDDHYHIREEKGHTSHSYRFDSLSNRVAKDGEMHQHNHLNQLIVKGEQRLQYDLNGNLLQCVKEGKFVEYRYDALDRLTHVKKDGKEVIYTYDVFNRRLSKIHSDKEEKFLYQGQEEVGKWVEGQLEEFRVMGHDVRDGVIAIELQGNTYIPLHDLFGNIACLLDLQGNVVERYRYTAYGEKEIVSPEGEVRKESVVKNPWQYASKREDEETGLVAFGLRFYDPDLGRWITTDPAGYIDGTNLYAYVHTSPLANWDQLGLYLENKFANTIYNGIAHGFSSLSNVFSGGFDPNGSTENAIHHVNPEADDQLGEYYRDLYKIDIPYERTGTYNLNDASLFSRPDNGQPFNLKEDPNKMIIFTNGIATNFDEFKHHMQYIGGLTDYNITGVHAASQGFLFDSFTYIWAMSRNNAYEGVRELQKNFHDYFSKCSSDATLMVICHSRGAVYVRNALMGFDPELRKRIEVIAIAPGGYIPPELCKSVKHYVSKGDFIPLFDMVGYHRYQSTIIKLDVMHWNCVFDHSFNSPTYIKVLETEIKDYTRKSK